MAYPVCVHLVVSSVVNAGYGFSICEAVLMKGQIGSCKVKLCIYAVPSIYTVIIVCKYENLLRCVEASHPRDASKAKRGAIRRRAEAK